jgi:hypothetical protein
MATTNEQLKQDEIGRLISADKVKGTPVHNPQGESLGTIENVMIDKPSGRVAYAVLAFGGILGMGKDRRALPWDVLEYDTEEDAYIIALDADLLRNGPAYDEANTNWDDPAWGRKVDTYYDVRPSTTLPPAD